MFKSKYLYISLILIIFLFTLSGCKDTSKPIEKSGLLLNTTIKITLYDSKDENILNQCFDICKNYDKLLSRTNENSEIYKLNKTGILEVSDDTLEVIKRGIYYGNLSNGAFDISIQPVSSLWDFTADEPSIPDSNLIAQGVSHVDYTKIKISGNLVTLEDGMGIDLGAIAKGYIADKMKEYLVDQGVKSAIINLGGNVLCVGEKTDGSVFNVGIQNPFENRNETLEGVKINNMSVVTSGVYERHFVIDGVNYHHILNPDTGYPYQNGLVSVSIISEKSVDGDGLSTTCFALGFDKGMELINSLDNTYAVFVKEDGSVYYSDGYEENFK